MIRSYSRFGAVTSYYNKKQRIIYTLVNKDGRWGSRDVDAPVVLDDSLPGNMMEIRWGPLGGNVYPPQPTAVVAYAPTHFLVVNVTSTGGVPSTVRIDVPTFDLKPGDIMRAADLNAPLTFISAAEAQAALAPPPPAPEPVPAAEPVPAPAPIPPPLPVPPAAPPEQVVLTPAPAPTEPMPIQPTGQTAVVDIPGPGPTPVPIFFGPVVRPTIQPGPGGKPVIILPPQQSNLLTMPTREAVRARLVEEQQEGLPPGMYDPDEFFPRYTPEHLLIRARQAKGRSRPADPAAEADSVDVSLWQIRAGNVDLFDRRYPTTRAIRTLPTAPPSGSGLVPVKNARPGVLEATPETDGAVLVQVPSQAAAAASAPAGKSAGGGMVVAIAGGGAGFLIAGPIGAAVGLAAALLLGRKG